MENQKSKHVKQQVSDVASWAESYYQTENALVKKTLLFKSVGKLSLHAFFFYYVFPFPEYNLLAKATFVASSTQFPNVKCLTWVSFGET